ncbi:MAG TPA: class I SAM-dependent methyltransferase [Candidatus Elarobacter sp.]|nr:class I SAM-dependent methyltransferase [Candidatus Elarobacter sp.]
MPFTGERYVPEVRGQIYYEHVHRYALAFELARDLDVLDIASGEGYGAAYLAIAARSVVGVDIDAESIRHAASRYTAMNLSFLAGSCTRIPLPDASIDLVVSFETLEHIEEHEQFMREVVRVLRPQGRLVISSPNKLVYSDQGHYHNPFHARELYFDQFRDLLQHWFAHTRIYGQRIIAASAIHPLRGVAADARCIGPMTRADERGLPALPAPAYFIALCFRTPPKRDLELLDSVFVDPRDDLLEDIVHPESLFAQPGGTRDGVLEIDPPASGQRVLELMPGAANGDGDAQLARAEEERRDARGAEREQALQLEIARLAEELEHERARAAEAARPAAEAAEQQSAFAAEEASGLEQRAAAAEARALSAERACRALENRLEQAQAAVRDAAADRAADGALVEGLRADLARCRAEHADAQGQLAAVLRSASWRVTRPIREVLRSFRGT